MPLIGERDAANWAQAGRAAHALRALTLASRAEESWLLVNPRPIMVAAATSSLFSELLRTDGMEKAEAGPPATGGSLSGCTGGAEPYEPAGVMPIIWAMLGEARTVWGCCPMWCM